RKDKQPVDTGVADGSAHGHLEAPRRACMGTPPILTGPAVGVRPATPAMIAPLRDIAGCGLYHPRMQKPGTLHVVATPIGNLGDLSPRALDTLKGVDAICAEDTRHTRQLLSHFGVERPLLALHQHNEEAQLELPGA